MSLLTTSELHLQLKECKQQKLQIEQEMQNKNIVPKGTVDFDLYRMKKEQNQLQEKITKINSVLHPNIIA